MPEAFFFILRRAFRKFPRINAMKNEFKASLCMCASAAGFSLMAALVKMSANVPFIQKTFFRNLIAFILASLLLAKDFSQKKLVIPKGSMKILLLRSIFGTIGIFANFYALGKMHLPDVAILQRTGSFLTLLLCFIFLHEEVKLFSVLCMIGAFIGVVIVIKPTGNFSRMFPALMALLSTFSSAAAYTCVRKLNSMKCNPRFLVAFFSLFSLLCAVPNLVLNYSPMSFSSLLCLLFAGVAAAIGQFGMTFAFRFAPASRVSIFDYTQVIFSAIFGYFFFAETVSYSSLIGYLLIFSMAFINFLYNFHK